MAEFGEQLKKAREQKGITQQTLADQLYVSRQAVSRWECGARYPDLIMTQKIANILNVSMDELMSNDFHKSTETISALENDRFRGVKLLMYGSLFVSYFLSVITGLYSSGIQSFSVQSVLYCLENIGILLILMAGLYLIASSKMTFKKQGALFLMYFGLKSFCVLIRWVLFPALYKYSFLWIGYMLCLMVLYAFYIIEKQRISSLMYGLSLVCLVMIGVQYIQMITSIKDIFAFLIQTIWMISNAGWMLLMVLETYIYEKKHKTSAE